LVLPVDDFMFSLCLQGNDTAGTVTSFVFLVVAIHQPEQVSFVWCTNHDKPRLTNFISKISADTKP
jgi:hypothetical protein